MKLSELKTLIQRVEEARQPEVPDPEIKFSIPRAELEWEAKHHMGEHLIKLYLAPSDDPLDDRTAFGNFSFLLTTLEA